MMMIAPNSRARNGWKKRGEVKGEFEGTKKGIMQPSQQYVSPCVKGVECGWGTRGLRTVAVF